MEKSTKSITLLMADDDPDDRMLAVVGEVVN